MKNTLKSFTIRYGYAALIASLFILNSCDKEKVQERDCNKNDTEETTPINGTNEVTKVMSVAQIRSMADGTTMVLFNENPQVFKINNENALSSLRSSLSTSIRAKISFNPWSGEIISVTKATEAELKAAHKKVVKGVNNAIQLDGRSMDFTQFDVPERIGSINTTGPGLTNVIPDMATAQAMFNYITQQCCAIGAPYEIDQCISFQYAQDGCYARAHKMCYILNNTYHYETHKIFSFANAGADVLSVQAQKWGGCCVNWWYHVAPLVNIKTPTGVKAYVFDPAMFNQPVLLSEWLRGQENPACVSWGYPNVSMINLQPTEMYAPSDYSGYSFMTDPSYFDTNSTMVSYSTYVTCP